MSEIAKLAPQEEIKKPNEAFTKVHEMANNVKARMITAREAVTKTGLPIATPFFRLQLKVDKPNGGESLFEVAIDTSTNLAGGSVLQVIKRNPHATEPSEQWLTVYADPEQPIKYVYKTYNPDNRYGNESGSEAAKIEIRQEGVSSQITDKSSFEGAYKGLEDMLWDLKSVVDTPTTL